MKFRAFIGIDVSKSTIDIYLRNAGRHAVFVNDLKGFEAMVEWLMDILGQVCPEEMMFGMEHTGLYSELLISFLDDHNFPFTVLPGLEVKKSMGIRRGKSDKADSKVIAEYIYEKREKIKLFRKPSRNLESIRKIASYRERLVKERTAFKTRLGEHQKVYGKESYEIYTQSHKQIIACLDNQIKGMEAEMERLIKDDQEMLRQYQLVKSVKGIGPQTAIMMIVLTKAFTAFPDWRKFASYAGIAPFPNQSGTYMGKTRTSKLANKRIKALLTMCAGVAVQYNPEMRLYYEQRVNKGKNKMSTMNIIRNKLVSRIFAVIERGTPYVETMKYAA
ncbi:IS110 family RNA-guided transposase [Cyclobacterium marinum]|uniref:Transposase IS116/IS110/IS902 family protein n=1 Tax=Cyclobacterium marinum (strain ATCC 25205 / DSM 745 / LMG 13164 / NCIMB 1802) TaxID=880070 RepID=G0J2C7_CYCMS|nr:IS110 family transposase [Cyclobacterium marinum]AEL24791.1 transposase IS116/IS110/IS902 family protein [Cyclobacterium marinum DSM 745]AEL25201.1 transposase IS116/IS110/IS902 family protein [Cyclobacterium marinum DSM 745]AEL25202.1 transposase IS116/IS110/IS902 family protein [Cyclobacterium marinum DSM 745]AEL25856.1 transposase IS116/IS110/IS902 family protein [Cyclobacterium marinum DSM 745]AEL25883.1 transposase IS116/IS110/IS902 family protein [Cyclobacterium marinum DSM 745]|tara:strand:- start:49 stop:1044 length:996 start_codon:yes stop_codon:yes gene_type:complete